MKVFIIEDEELAVKKLVSELILKLQDFDLEEDQIEEILDLVRSVLPTSSIAAD